LFFRAFFGSFELFAGLGWSSRGVGGTFSSFGHWRAKIQKKEIGKAVALCQLWQQPKSCGLIFEINDDTEISDEISTLQSCLFE
jgi:hypothetical protein